MTKRWTKHLPAFVVALAATVIGGYVVARLAGTPPSAIAAFLWSPFGNTFAWVRAPARLDHWDVALLVLIPIALYYFSARRVQRVKELAISNIRRLHDIENPENGPESESEADAELAKVGDSEAPRRFEPEKFDLNGPRSRALLGLLQRVDTRTTLADLYRFVMPAGPSWVDDTGTTKAQLQFDMEEAERLGIVSIDRISPLTHCYSLTAPDGRDWVLRNKAKLHAEAPKGMRQRDPRSPYR